MAVCTRGTRPILSRASARARGERRTGPTLASVSRHWRQQEESFLFISPHDDDVVIAISQSGETIDTLSQPPAP